MKTKLKEALESISQRLPGQAPMKDFIHINILYAFQHLHFEDALREASKFYREPITAPVHQTLFRITANYLDQGIGTWTFPTLKVSYWESLHELQRASWLPIAPYAKRKRVLGWLQQDPLAVIEKILNQFNLDQKHIETTLMAHPGWSGMVNQLEKNPHYLLKPRPIKLIEFLAFKLILESEYGFKDLPQQAHPPSEIPINQKTNEKAYYDGVIDQIVLRKNSVNSENTPEIQAIFCIDDRECSFRRHWEALESGLETLSTAGYFGIDMMFQSLNDSSPRKLAPAPLSVHRHVHERPHPEHLTDYDSQKRKQLRMATISERLRHWLGFVLTRKEFIEVPTELDLSHYSLDDMAHRVFSVLNQMGMRYFASTVIITAHGSSSVNNPYFAAYGCGACSGNPGAPNARAFSQMANIPEVRQRVERLGLTIPPRTRFYPAYHDTCTDDFIFLETNPLSNSQMENLDLARAQNAQERCSMFEVVPMNIAPADALKEVRHRSRALFEPRPELGHAKNALCIVGPRYLTNGLSLERRAFLNSYEPGLDPNGEILDSVLSAAVPVCAGINLDYYFSKFCPWVYGSGTKLSHNIAALLGVYNGVDDDLRTGLPVQMTEMHDLIRLCVIVFQKHDVVQSVLEKNPAIHQWVQNKWIAMASIDPTNWEVQWLS